MQTTPETHKETGDGAPAVATFKANVPVQTSLFDQQIWGLIDYALACERQLELVDHVANGRKLETLVFCSHPPVVTLGRTTPKTDLIGWSGSVMETSRGGRATYHGPSQLVIYPIVDLRREDRAGLRERNVGGYIRLLGETVTQLLQESGAPVELRQGSENDEQGHTRQLTGVWAGERKVASIGVAVRKWITYHGVAINLCADEKAFSGIRPCGFKPGTMISMQELLGKKISADQLGQRFAQLFEAKLTRS
ncbi:MAG: lipoyl(octanoyl) transferase LipB [Bdellovibrionales bacterium]